MAQVIESPKKLRFTVPVLGLKVTLPWFGNEFRLSLEPGEEDVAKKLYYDELVNVPTGSKDHAQTAVKRIMSNVAYEAAEKKRKAG